MPVLKLPKDNEVIENVAISQGDPIVCTADVGYPANDKELKIQLKLNNSDSFVDFLKPAVVTDCTENATVTTTFNTRLNRTVNGAAYRCGIFKNGNLSTESPVRTLRVIPSKSTNLLRVVNITLEIFRTNYFHCSNFFLTKNVI